MNQKTNLVRFDQKMDELLANVIGQNLGTPEFRTEYVKATNLYKRVAEYDVELASELLPCKTMSVGRQVGGTRFVLRARNIPYVISRVNVVGVYTRSYFLQHAVNVL